MKLSIIILTYNTKDLTINCLKSLYEFYGDFIQKKDIEIIVCDNKSEDQTLKEIERENFNNLILIKNDKNLGFAKGNNIAAKTAKGEVLLFLNSDTIVTNSGFMRMIDLLNENHKIGILGARLLNTNRTVQLTCGKYYNIFNLFISLFGGGRMGLFRDNPQDIAKVDWVSGGCMMIRKEIFEKIGGFDEDFFMYIEDMELCYKAKKAGFITYFYPYVEVLHQEHGSSNRTFAVTQIYKGTMIFYKKHKTYFEFFLAKSFFKIKAFILVILGKIINNKYLENTYLEILKK